MGRYVNMNIGKVNTYSNFLYAGQCMLRHSVTVVIPPTKNMERKRLVRVVSTDIPSDCNEPPPIKLEIAAQPLIMTLKQVRTAAGQIFIVISKQEKSPRNNPLISSLP